MATWRLKFNRMLAPLFQRTGIIQGALATKLLADATPNEAEEESAATTGLQTKVSLTPMLQVASAFRDLTGLGQCDAHTILGL